jgi:hypothetical protein
MPSSPNLNLPYLEAAQAQKHVTHNEALRVLDAVVQLAVVAVSTSPPGSPADGERHIVGAAPTGAFAGHANEIAVWQDGAWVFLAPRAGWRAWDAGAALLRVWSGAAWTALGGGGGAGVLDDLGDVTLTAPQDGEVLTFSAGQWVNDVPSGGGSGDVTGPAGGVADGDVVVFDGTTGKAIRKGRGAVDYLGVGAAPDATSTDTSNRLIVRGSRLLLFAIPAAETPGTGDIKIQVSKEATANSASFFFSNNFSGRAEFGLVESDAFKLKVSADGSNWIEAMSFDPASGRVDLGPSKASDADVRAAVANRVLTADRIETASAAVALTDAATVAVDWDAGINFTLVATANRQIGSPTNGQPGTWRTILVQGNNATARTISFGSQFLGDVPVITDCSDAKWYLITIFCVSATHFVASAVVAKKP